MFGNNRINNFNTSGEGHFSTEGCKYSRKRREKKVKKRRKKRGSEVKSAEADES